MIKQFVPKEFCLVCQGCCRFREAESIWSPCLLDSEIEELCKKNISPAAVSSKKRIQLIPNPNQDDFVCIFLNIQDNKCKIYLRRPFECQLYPFLIQRHKENVFLALDLKCPFIKGRLESVAFQKYVKYLTALLSSPRFKETLKNNPGIIQAYPEVLNLRELNF